MVLTCSVIGCSNRHSKEIPRQFFQFPLKNEDVLKLWIDALARENFTPSKFSKVCSDHFKESDYLTRPGIYVKRLKPDAVPSLLLGHNEGDREEEEEKDPLFLGNNENGRGEPSGAIEKSEKKCFQIKLEPLPLACCFYDFDKTTVMPERDFLERKLLSEFYPIICEMNQQGIKQEIVDEFLDIKQGIDGDNIIKQENDDDYMNIKQEMVDDYMNIKQEMVDDYMNINQEIEYDYMNIKQEIEDDFINIKQENNDNYMKIKQEMDNFMEKSYGKSFLEKTQTKQVATVCTQTEKVKAKVIPTKRLMRKKIKILMKKVERKDAKIKKMKSLIKMLREKKLPRENTANSK